MACICIFVILPLNLVGTVLGRNLAGQPNYPCRINAVPRPIPEKKWYESISSYLTIIMFSLMFGMYQLYIIVQNVLGIARLRRVIWISNWVYLQENDYVCFLHHRHFNVHFHSKLIKGMDGCFPKAYAREPETYAGIWKPLQRKLISASVQIMSTFFTTIKLGFQRHHYWA